MDEGFGKDLPLRQRREDLQREFMAIRHAISKGDLLLVREWIEKKETTLARGNKDHNHFSGHFYGQNDLLVMLNGLLPIAVLHEKREIVELLLNHKADINGHDMLLFHACKGNGENSVEMVRLLLDRGVNIHALPGAALSEAIENGNREIVQLLLERGADLFAQEGRVTTRLLMNKGSGLIRGELEKRCPVLLKEYNRNPNLIHWALLCKGVFAQKDKKVPIDGNLLQNSKRDLKEKGVMNDFVWRKVLSKTDTNSVFDAKRFLLLARHAHSFTEKQIKALPQLEAVLNIHNDFLTGDRFSLLESKFPSQHPQLLRALADRCSKVDMDQFKDDWSLLRDVINKQGLAGLPERFGWTALWAWQKAWHDEVVRRGMETCSDLQWDSLIQLQAEGGFEAIPLTSGKLLWEEGHVMHHCVSNYADKCRDGKSAVFSIRRGDTRIGTLELVKKEVNASDSGWEVAQFRGKYNARVTNPEALAFVQKIGEQYTAVQTLLDKTRLNVFDVLSAVPSLARLTLKPGGFLDSELSQALEGLKITKVKKKGYVRK